jgi:hypothetical protein
VTTFCDCRITSTVPCAYNVILQDGPEALPGIIWPAGKKSKIPERRTTARVPNSALLLAFNNARSSSSSSMQTLQNSLRGDSLLENITSK